MRFRVIVKRVAIATSAVIGGASLGLWALPKLQKDDEVSVLYMFILYYILREVQRIWEK